MVYSEVQFAYYLLHQWDTAGTGRYVRNVAVWLLGLEHRMSIGAPLQGPIPDK